MVFILPDKLLRSIGEDETILYQSQKITNKKARNFSVITTTLGLNLIGILVFIFLLDNLILKLSVIGIFLLISTPVLIILTRKEEKEETYFLLTDSKLYVYKHSGDKFMGFMEQMMGNIQSYELKTIRGIVFRKRFFDKNRDSGTIEFLSYDVLPRIIKLKNVPNMLKVQEALESILYHYGNVVEKREELRRSDSYKFPLKFEISPIKMAQLRKSIIIASIILILLPIVAYVLTLIINNLFAFIFFPTMAFIFIIMVLIRIIVVSNRKSKRNSKLIVTEREFELEVKGRKTTITLDKFTSISILYSKGPFAKPISISENYDTLRIQKSYKSNEKIVFGPFTALPYILDMVFTHLICWKFDQGFLMAKNELISLNS